MQPLNETTPNDLFRFVNLRGPARQKESISRVAFVSPPDDPAAEGERTKRGDLYPSLRRAQGLAKPLEESLKLVRRYQASEAFIADTAGYGTLYPELSTFIGWLDAHAETATLDGLEKKFASTFRLTPDKFVAGSSYKEAQHRIWDNLFANLFQTRNAALVTWACKYLGTLNLIALLAEGAAPADSPGTAYRARPLLPSWILALAASVDRKPDEGVADQEGVTSEGGVDHRLRYRLLSEAVQDVDRLIARKRRAARDAQDVRDRERAEQPASQGPMDAPSRQPRSPAKRETALSDPFEAAEGDLKSLDKATVRFLQEIVGPASTYDLNHARQSLIREAATAGSAAATDARKMAVKVGGAVVDLNGFCAQMKDKDPCGRFPRGEFSSRGSFVASALIGDLLVTKQQLVKYDLGEVAHVENAMAGLEKTRTHRRLHRTEETEVYESISSTETERETQTTDRFDMEKESSKTLEQNFQVDAGVNVSGSYGTVTFTSSLDASYGGNSSQSESEATSFSKSVTTRALSRVKETVRRSKTVTLFNELEETSVNSVKNSSDDHINGVYRWLDKFYLNKIINYGKRLMFEFSIPEPAQFYLFRQLNRPKSGDVMLKPEHPAEVKDPSEGSMKAPIDLTEANYAFWAALYGAAMSEGPPPLYMRVSEAWKNTYATLQSGDMYDAFNASLALPPDYEAVSAHVLCDHFWWGDYNISGAIGTAAFGAGYSSPSLPNITKSLGVALLSCGMNWKLNVVVTCERSPGLYHQWQVKTYNTIMEAYAARLREYEAWLQAQSDDSQDLFSIQGKNPLINRECEREELKKRCLEMFTGQRFESFDAAVDGIQNVSGYPEILFAEAVREGNVVKFFEQAFDWANMTYVFYPYFWGRKPNWLSTTTLEDPSDPLFTKFLQAGYARAVVPVRPGFENYLMIFHMITDLVASMGCSWNFNPSVFGTLGLSNTFSPAIDDPTYISIAEELQSAAGYTDEEGPIYGTPYVQKVPTNLVYIAQNAHVAGAPWPGLPDNSADPTIAPYL